MTFLLDWSMTSLPLFRQMFAYSSMASVYPTLVKWFAFGSYLLHTHHTFCQIPLSSAAASVEVELELFIGGFSSPFSQSPLTAAVIWLFLSWAIAELQVNEASFSDMLLLFRSGCDCKYAQHLAKKVRKEKNNIGVFRLENVKNIQSKRKEAYFSPPICFRMGIPGICRSANTTTTQGWQRRKRLIVFIRLFCFCTLLGCLSGLSLTLGVFTFRVGSHRVSSGPSLGSEATF